MICPACDHDNIPGVDQCAGCGMDLAGLDVEAWGVDPDDPLLNLPLDRLALKVAPVLPPSATVSEALKLMQERHEGCVFIADSDDRLAGVFTERDVTIRIAAPGRDPEKTRLAEVMTVNPVALRRQDPLAWALHRMGVDGHRHLPVLDQGRLVGFLSVRTVLQTLIDPPA